MLDLHTVPGSQNGFDNGGLTGIVKWQDNEKEVIFALDVLERLAQRYGHQHCLYGIEVLNEPVSRLVFEYSSKPKNSSQATGDPNQQKTREGQEAQESHYVTTAFLKRFYSTAYTRLRRHMDVSKVIVFHDGFRMMQWPAIFMTRKFRMMKNIALDTHIYLTNVEHFLADFLPKRINEKIDGKADGKISEKLNKKLSRKLFSHDGQQRIALRKKLYRAFFNFQKLRAFLVKITGVSVIVGEWCLENEVGKEKPQYNAEFAQLQKESYSNSAISVEFFWSYQLYRDEKSREKQKRTWRELWDWRQCHENGWF